MLIEEHYPWFLETYDGMDEPIMRADAVRTALSVSAWLLAYRLHNPNSCSHATMMLACGRVTVML